MFWLLNGHHAPSDKASECLLSKFTGRGMVSLYIASTSGLLSANPCWIGQRADFRVLEGIGFVPHSFSSGKPRGQIRLSEK